MKSYRRKYLSIVEDILKRKRIKFQEIEPFEDGKKGLVYLVKSSAFFCVVRLYHNPLKFFRLKKAYKILSNSYLKVSPSVLEHGIFIKFLRPFGFVVEEYVFPFCGFDRDIIEEFFLRFSLFQKDTLVRKDAKNFWENAVKKTKGRWSYLLRELKDHIPLIELESNLFNILSKNVPYYWNLFSFSHTDISIKNMGIIEHKLVLYDWDRWEFLPPQFDLVQALFSLKFLDEETYILDNVVDLFGIEKAIFLKTYYFCKLVFFVKRMKRSLKRGDLLAFNSYLSYLKDLVNNYPF